MIRILFAALSAFQGAIWAYDPDNRWAVGDAVAFGFMLFFGFLALMQEDK